MPSVNKHFILSKKQIKKPLLLFLTLILLVFGMNFVRSTVYSSYIGSILKHNIHISNLTVSLVKQFDKEILATLENTPSDEQLWTSTFTIDSLISKIREQQSRLKKGVENDTITFYMQISDALDYFVSLLIESKNYLQFQSCFRTKHNSYIDSQSLQSQLLTELSKNLNLSDNVDLYEQIISIYSLRVSIYNSLNTCFEPNYSPLKTSEWDTMLSSVISVYNEQLELLKPLPELAKEKNDTEIESIILKLSSNESRISDVFSSPITTSILYSPISLLNKSKQELSRLYTIIIDTLNELKSKYNLK